MVHNTTYPDPQITYLINKTVGKPYSFLQRIKMGGIGSKRMNILELSPSLKAYQTITQETQFGFIELRPKGILVLVNRQLQNFTWPIPFSDLIVNVEQDLRVEMGEDFLIFEKGRNENAIFIQRIIKHIDVFE